jgi:serine/threonine protein phosphatase PrpC
MIETQLFHYSFCAASALDIGLVRENNEDRVIACPELGFYAVSDGMGGLTDGGQTSDMVARVLPGLIEQCAAEIRSEGFTPVFAANLLEESVRMVSDSIYEVANTRGRIGFGATLSGVWLVDGYAVFINLGDSRGYLLPWYSRKLRQVTEDHNVAQLLVQEGELTREQARGHRTSSQLTRFMGMPSPAAADYFIEKIRPGDRILLCSDGLSGMVEDQDIRGVMRSSKSPVTICGRLVGAAKAGGGRDNISAVYIKIERPKQMAAAR